MNTMAPAPYPLEANSLSALGNAQAAAATASAALSHEYSPTDTTLSNGKKRRPSGQPGSRGVANLTPEQLVKKRANDREAQRAIRERTRRTIESLEQRIRELEGQQPFQELQRALAERDRAQAECEELRRRLGAVAGIVGGQHPSLNELAAVTAQQSPLPPIASHPQVTSYDGQQIDLRSQHSTAQPSPVSHTPSSSHGYSGTEGIPRRWSPSVEQHHSPQYPSVSDVHFREQQQQQQHQHQPQAPFRGQHQSNGERLGLSFLLETSHQGYHSSNVATDARSNQSPRIQEQPIWAQLTNVGPKTHVLDGVLNDFHASRRLMIREGASLLETLGPDYPSFAALMDKTTDCHPVSAVLVNIIHSFPDISNPAEKAAVLYIMFLIMRWLICPCQDCYERLPDWCKPNAEQLDVSHAAWQDFLPWPHMRKQACLSEKPIELADFFVPYTTTLSLNWTLSDEAIFLKSSPASTSDERSILIMSPLFEAHIRDLDNWSVGTRLQKAYPHLFDATVRIRGN